MIDTTTAKQRWLDARWPFVRAHLPPAPARVLEIGCGPEGGFVPAMREHGYDAVGVDSRRSRRLPTTWTCYWPSTTTLECSRS